MSSSALIHPEEESLLLAALHRAYLHSPFWRDRFLGLGLKPNDFRPGFDFEQLPFITKQDLLADQAAEPPFGRLLAVDPSQVRRVHKTSGTSAAPLLVALTDRDIADTYTASRRAFGTAGLGPGERIVHCLNFNMWSGGVSDYIPLELCGATCIPFGVGNTAQLLRLIRSLGITAISSTPSYMYALRDRCRAELGIDPRELGLRRGYFGGEGMLQVPGVRADIEETFGMTAMDANYGMSEVLSIIAGEGPERNGLINHTHGVLRTELIDAEGRSLPIQTGARGELVFSSLRREAQPLFRYRTNDLVEIVWAKVEEDGLTRMRFNVIGRTDEMLVIKGVNFFPQSLLSIVAEHEPAMARGYRVIRPRDGSVEELKVHCETTLTDPAERAHLARAFEDRVAQLLQVRIRVYWAEPGALAQEGNKIRYLIRESDVSWTATEGK